MIYIVESELLVIVLHTCILVILNPVCVWLT